jgi:hypothetical protein
LFEIDIAPLEQQKRNREFELIVQTCIMNTIRDRIPIETLLRQYIDETQEIEIIKEEKISEPKIVDKPMPVIKPQVIPQAMPQPMNNDNFNELNDLNSNLNKIMEPHNKVEFAEKNSVLTFESEKDDSDIISIGDNVPLNNLDFEDLDLDLSKKGDKVELSFEEL